MFLEIIIYLLSTITLNNMGNTPAAQKTLTSLKLEPQEFDSFKVTCVRTKFSLSKLVDRAMHLYNNDETFRKLMHSYKHEMTGSIN